LPLAETLSVSVETLSVLGGTLYLRKRISLYDSLSLAIQVVVLPYADDFRRLSRDVRKDSLRN